MVDLIFLEDAQKEFQQSAEWYEEKMDNLGIRFQDAVHERIENLKWHPKRYPKRKNNFRVSPLKSFPFVIVYTFYEDKNIIIINSVFHTSRNPLRKYRKS
jgi:mRNA-degrading endonuclease RelE of RelBE toxin-antitoxin system